MQTPSKDSEQISNIYTLQFRYAAGAIIWRDLEQTWKQNEISF